VLPRLPDFLTEYPDIQFYMSEGDRLVDLIREGIDCVLRVGQRRHGGLVLARPRAVSFTATELGRRLLRYGYR
jgi:DNA-binding transcriptional LysR family regulator